MAGEFLIVTIDRFWGKGATIYEAAKNAEIDMEPRFGSVYWADPEMIDPGTIFCNELGDVEWLWTKKTSEVLAKFDNDDQRKWLCEKIINNVRVAQGYITFENNKVIISSVFEQDTSTMN